MSVDLIFADIEARSGPRLVTIAVAPIDATSNFELRGQSRKERRAAWREAELFAMRAKGAEDFYFYSEILAREAGDVETGQEFLRKSHNCNDKRRAAEIKLFRTGAPDQAAVAWKRRQKSVWIQISAEERAAILADDERWLAAHTPRRAMAGGAHER